MVWLSGFLIIALSVSLLYAAPASKRDGNIGGLASQNLSFFLSCVAGPSVLRSPLAVEELGGGQDPRADDGPRHRRGAGRGEAAKEAAAARLPRRQPQAPQLVGLQILLL